MVRTFLPFTATGSVRPAFWAWARSSNPQLQNTTPVAAAAPPLRKFRRRKFRRVVIGCPSQDRLVPGSLQRCVGEVELGFFEAEEPVGLFERGHDGRFAEARGPLLLGDQRRPLGACGAGRRD